jgi:hypothetical protein
MALSKIKSSGLDTTGLRLANVSVTGTANLGPVSGVTITGGTPGYVLTTDGSGNLSWAAATSSSSTSSTTATTVDSFTGDGKTVTFVLSVTPSSINQTTINYNGALQLRSSYSLVGNNIVFSEAPYPGSIIEVTTTQSASSSSSSYITRTYTGDGVTTTFVVTSGVTVSSVLVIKAGAVQIPTTDYTVSGSVLSFVTAPLNGVNIQIRELVVLAATTTTDTISPFLLMGA